MKNILINGIKECIFRGVDGTTDFIDIASLSQKYSRFNLKAISTNSCFKAKAIPEDNIKNWFQIDYDPETRKVSKTCGDPSKKDCDEGNTW